MARKSKKIVDVKAEMLEATSIKPRKNETDEDLSARVANYVSNKMDEDAYESLSKEAKAWYEDYCEKAAEEADLPSMPTVEAEGGEEEEAPKKGKAAAKKGKKAAKEEEEEEEEEAEEEEEEEEEEKPKKGKKAAAAKKGKKGKKEEPEEEEEEEEEEEKPKKGKKAAAAKKGKKAKAEVEEEDEEEEEEEKPKKGKKGKKASAGEGRAAGAPTLVQILCKNPKLTAEQAGQKLAAAGYEMADSQIKKIHRTVHRVIELLTEQGWSKG